MALLSSTRESIAAPNGQTRIGVAAVGANNPFADGGPAVGVVRAAPANDTYEFFSIEDFPPGIGDLGLTHDDAQGFYNYVAQFVTPNAWYRDGNVLAWMYGEDFDNWQDEYGFDSCCVVYHSGHGNMDANGVFQCPMGGTWGGASWVFSNGMRLGNEKARYIFWSTCLSLRVLGGHSPVRTWHGANGGFRMLFGFETVSFDNANYGRYFWEEWNKNKSFSQAWLDGSWRISHNQAPSVVATGANQAEAEARLNQERYFTTAPGSAGWYAWRWYNVARQAGLREPNSGLPGRIAVATLAAPAPAEERVRQIAERLGLQVGAVESMQSDRSVQADIGNGRLALAPDGSYELRLAEPVAPRADADPGQARHAAEEIVRRYGLADDIDLVYDVTRLDNIASAPGGSDGSPATERVREITVVFRQVVNGLPVVSPDRGEVRVTVDPAGNLLGIADTTRRVAGLSERRSTAMPPTGPGASAGELDEQAVAARMEDAVQRRLRQIASGGHVPQTVEVVPGTEEVGYALRDTTAVLAARRTIEVELGHGLRKRYDVEVPLAE
jgi:hypothetical protein